MAPENEKKKRRTSKKGVVNERPRNDVGKVIMDPRFSSVHFDPRFREAPKKNSKVVIDSRFNHMFTDRNFASSKAPVDKRGKRRKNSQSQNPLKHYYRLEDEENEVEKLRERKKGAATIEEESDSQKNGSEKESGSESNSEEVKKRKSLLTSGSESEDEVEELKKRKSLLTSELEESSESEEDISHEIDESSSTSTTDSDEEDQTLEDEEEDDPFKQDENIPEIQKETHRLAAVNLDWNEVRAVDLYVLLSSFLPKGGQIMSVAVYPSEFGLKRMEEEAVHGPSALFDDDEEDEQDDEIDNKKLRFYELSRLRYYYAVVECDSTATADYLYKTCDGVEFERSSNKLDLRFIPDTMEFKQQPRDVATEAPADYEGIDFQTRALQHSNIHLTWDEDEPQRTKTLKRKLNDKQLDELEFREFLASDESEEDDDCDDDDNMEDRSVEKRRKQDMYRALIQSGDGSDEDNEDNAQDMEVTFNTGLEEISKRMLEKDKKSETVWEAYLRKRKEKKKARKNESKNSSGEESSDAEREHAEQPDDFFVEEETQVRGTKTKKSNRETVQEAEATRAELELLLADETGMDNNLKGYNLKPKKGKKGEKGKEFLDEGKIPDADFDDPRFSSLFTSPLFALDPTDPQFKRSAVYARQMAQKMKGEEKNATGTIHSEISGQSPSSDKLEMPKEKDLQPNSLNPEKGKNELSSMLKSIKMKTKKANLSSQSNVKENVEPFGGKPKKK